MAIMDPTDRDRLHRYLLDAFDDDNAGDMQAFARNFLHNSKVWDTIADVFPKASVSQVKAVMMDAYGAWEKQRTPE